MADLQVTDKPALFNCLGLGSCIGLVGLDRSSGIAGMVHIMLPEAFKDKPVDKPGKFADTGIAELFAKLEAAGANKSRIAYAYAGGAQVFKFGSSADTRMDVGLRNIRAVEEILAGFGIKPVAFDVGGSSGRTVTVDTVSGIVKVRTVVSGEKVLCNLKELRAVAA
ncbi:MAG: chemotaxis protein CheD [Chthonomonadaceae bacterium]|jgi:chemotaxis protein CheD|nr:chemotaxis protein CheD [Chthonomonadaceae bacterium]